MLMIRLLGWLAAIVTFPVLALAAVVGFLVMFVVTFIRQLTVACDIDPQEYAKQATMDWCNFEIPLSSQFELRKHTASIERMDRNDAVQAATMLVTQSFHHRHLLNQFTRRVAELEARCLSRGIGLPSQDKADRTAEISPQS